MKVLSERQKSEAITRLQMLDVPQKLLEYFKKYHQPMKMHPFLNHYVELTTAELDKIRKLEEEYDFITYLVIHSFKSGYFMDSLLYVGNYDESEWEEDRLDIKQGYPLTYTINLDVPIFSEFGSISIVNRNGLLYRL